MSLIPFSYWKSQLSLPEIPTSGLNMYFNFKGENDWYVGSGSVVKDYSPLLYNGTMSGGIDWLPDAGGAMRFNGIARTLATNRNSAFSNVGIYYGSWSIVYVARFPNTTGLKYVFGSSNSPGYGLNALSGANGSGIVYTHNTLSPPTYSSISANTWYHVVCSYDYNSYTPKIYINGTLQVTGFQERMINVYDIAIARTNTTYYEFDLGLAMIYNRVITSSEVSDIYNNQKGRFEI